MKVFFTLLVIFLFCSATNSKPALASSQVITIGQHQKLKKVKDIFIDKLPWRLVTYQQFDTQQPKVLLLPGSLMDDFSFAEMMKDSLDRQKMTLITALPPGFGPQKFHDARYNVSDYIEYYHRFIEETGPYDAIVGHSFSANVLIELNRKYGLTTPTFAISPSFYYSHEKWDARFVAKFSAIFFHSRLYLFDFLFQGAFKEFLDPLTPSYKANALVDEAQKIISHNIRAQAYSLKGLYGYIKEIENEKGLPIEEFFLGVDTLFLVRAKNDVIYSSKEFLRFLAYKNRLIQPLAGGHTPMILAPVTINDAIAQQLFP